MIVKERDAAAARIECLERLMLAATDSDEKSSIRSAVARLRSDPTTEAACNFIDGYFADCPDWVVLHDLRLSFGKQTIHVNHLLINSVLEFFCLDTRYIGCGLTVSEQGACHSLRQERRQLIASPFAKLHRDKRFLTQLLKRTDVLPRSFGIRKPSSVRGFILTNSAIKSRIPASDLINTASVVCSDNLFQLIWKEPEHWRNKTMNPVSAEELEKVASAIAAGHTPAIAEHLMQMGSSSTDAVTELEHDSAHCSDCGDPVAEAVREQAFRNMETFGNRVLCTECQSSIWQNSKRANCW